MDAEYLELLRRADERDHFEYAEGFDWQREIDAVEAIRPALETAVGHTLELDRNVQDASFFTELAWHAEPRAAPGFSSKVILTYVAIRFSAFGHLYTIWGNVPEAPVPPETEAAVHRVLEPLGYAYVPCDCLEEPYTGAFQHGQIRTWWLRFFDYG